MNGTIGLSLYSGLTVSLINHPINTSSLVTTYDDLQNYSLSDAN